MDRIKEMLGILWIRKEVADRIKQYQSDFRIYWKLDFSKSGLVDEDLPYYEAWQNGSRVFCLLLIMALLGGVSFVICHQAIWWPFFPICLGLFYADIYPADHWYLKQRYSKVRIVWFCTRKTVQRLADSHEMMRALISSYEAEQTKRRQVEAAEKAKKSAIGQREFRPQFLILLAYVETYFKVTTPNPDCHEGYFTIMLPDCNVAGGTKEYVYEHSKAGVDQLIAVIADMDALARKRVELRELITANLSETANWTIPSTPPTQ